MVGQDGFLGTRLAAQGVPGVPSRVRQRGCVPWGCLPFQPPPSFWWGVLSLCPRGLSSLNSVIFSLTSGLDLLCKTVFCEPGGVRVGC